MPNDSLLEKQQAAYVAALLMDDGMSPRAASKVADYSRKESIDLAARRELSSTPTHTQQVVLEYLKATLELGMEPQDRTIEAVIAAFPVAEPERLTADAQALIKGGWRETNGYVNSKKPESPRTQFPWNQLDAEQERVHQLEHTQITSPDPVERISLILPPEDRRVGTDFLKEAALYHWNFRQPRTNNDNYVGLNEWPSRRTRIRPV